MSTPARRRTGEPIRPGGYNPERMERQQTKVATGGNSKCDRDWMKELAADLLEFKETPADCYWDVRYQFQGYADEVNPDFFTPYLRGQRHCVGIAYIRDERGGYILDLDGVRLQRICLGAPIYGATVCTKHGGQLETTKEAARRLIVDASEKAITTLVVLTGPRDDLNEIVEQKVRVQAANSILDRAGIKGDNTVQVKLPGYKHVMDKLFGEESDDDD